MTTAEDKAVRELDRRLTERGHTLAAFMPAGLGLPGIAFIYKRGDGNGYGGGYFGGGDTIVTRNAGPSFSAALAWLDYRPNWHRTSMITGRLAAPYWP